MSGLEPGRAQVRVLAPAKVNLSLRVGPPRPDGFHDLDTLFQAINLVDDLEINVGGKGIQLTVEGEDAGPPEDNLVVRAARAFFAVAGVTRVPALRVKLHKRVPVGAGLGGGSSDAAAMLRALDDLFPDQIDPMGLAEVAAALGSDVPFFMGDSPLARGLGRGDRLELITPLPALPGVVVMPPIRVATGQAYASLDRHRAARGWAAEPRKWKAPKQWETVAAAATNDFQEVIAGELPQVAQILRALDESDPLLALLSGSGAACFALFKTDAEASRTARAIERARLGRVYPIRTLTAWPTGARGQP